MRRSLYCSLLYLVCSALCVIILLSFTTVFASAESQKTATVSMSSYKGVRSVVAVTINGSGPYDFMVDTGATVTVLDGALFEELGLRTVGATKLTSSAGSSMQVRSSAREIAVGGLAVENLEVVSMKVLTLGSEDRGVRGILGENFLRHFDVLIDNQHRKITLDSGTGLAESLAGERLAMTFPGVREGEAMTYRPMVSVTLPGYSSHPVTVLLDSGADTLVVFHRGYLPKASGDGKMVRTVNGAISCPSSVDRLRWGKSTSEQSVVSCQSATVNPADHEGNLPTGIFRQIFISHAGSFVIVNPASRPRGLEIAVAGPTLR